MDKPTDVSIFIITENNEIIFNEEYDYTNDGEPAFIMLTNAFLNQEYKENNTVNISMKYLDGAEGENLPQCVFDMIDNRTDMQMNSKQNECFVWQSDRFPIYDEHDDNKDLYYDFDGQKYTIDAIEKSMGYMKFHNDRLNTHFMSFMRCRYNLEQKEQVFPAAFAAFTSEVKFNGKIYHGFVPSSGQLMIFYKNTKKIDDILIKKVTSNKEVWHYDNINNENWWSSSEVTFNKMWSLSYGAPDMSEKDSNRMKVLPLYTI